MQYIKIGGVILVVASFVVMAICLLHKNEPFFNLNQVFRKHFALFKNSKSQYLVFYVLPLILAIGLSMLYTAAEDFFTELSVILGIVLSVLLTILSILSGYDFSTVKNEEQRKKGKAVVTDTINAITFNSLLCIFLLLYNLVLIVLAGGDYSWVPFDVGILKIITSFIAYYLFSVICLTLLLVVKQMSKIIQFNLTVKREP
jgi:hypothetical protein